MKKSSILNEASEIRSFIEKNHKLPNYCTIDGNQVSVYSTSYLISRSLANTGKDSIPLVAIKKPSNRVSWAINQKVLLDDYLDMIRRFNNYCNEHKQVPSYIVTKRTGSKVGYELFVYCLAKIGKYFKENKVLPNYCIFNDKEFTNNAKQSTNTKNETKQSTSSNSNLEVYNNSPHYLNTGCNNLGQCTSYYCGVHSIHQVLRKFGITKYSESKLAAWAGTTTAGTDHQGINTAISKASGGSLKTKWINFSSLGKDTNSRFKALGKLISKSNTDCIIHNFYRLKYGHYETIHKIDHTNKVVYVLNSLGNKCSSTSYCGYIEKRSYNEFAKYIAQTPGNQPSICLITK